MDSKVEDGEDSDMEDMAYMEEKKWKIGDSEELIRVQEISKTFHLSAKQQKLEHSTAKTKTAVDQVSFCVNRGEVFGLLGPNGAGKTTTLRMLATLIRPDSGDAVLSGSSVVTQPEEVRRKIGFLTSEDRQASKTGSECVPSYAGSGRGCLVGRREKKIQIGRAHV